MEKCKRISKRKKLLLEKVKKRKQIIKGSKKCSFTAENVNFPEEPPVVTKFRHWCTTTASIAISDKVYIGVHGSSHGIGVFAKERIRKGEVLAVIPRSSTLSPGNSALSDLISTNIITDNSWIPLIITIINEYSMKDESYWCTYLNTVPNNTSVCSPPLLWSCEERERLLGAETGLYHLVDSDMKRLRNDYCTIIKPFMETHLPHVKISEEKVIEIASFIMSYSFTDPYSNDVLSETMMIPFVDLLNHNHCHHAELKFGTKVLKLIATRSINPGEEVMNTFGTSLPNYSLLHTHGFIDINNPVDKVCIPLNTLKRAFFMKDANWKRKRWSELIDKDEFDEIYEVDSNGIPDPHLLKVIKLLCSRGTSLKLRKRMQNKLLHKYIERCLANIPVVFAKERSLKEEYVIKLHQQLNEYLNKLLLTSFIM